MGELAVEKHHCDPRPVRPEDQEEAVLPVDAQPLDEEAQEEERVGDGREVEREPPVVGDGRGGGAAEGPVGGDDVERRDDEDEDRRVDLSA